MFDYPSIVELLTPKKFDENNIDSNLEQFALRYKQIIDSGCGLSIPDNPMGQPRMGALESIDIMRFPIDSEKVIMNLNTFHTKEELDQLLYRAADSGLKHILVVRGDGGPLLSKLDPTEIGGEKSVTTSIACLRNWTSHS